MSAAQQRTNLFAQINIPGKKEKEFGEYGAFLEIKRKFDSIKTLYDNFKSQSLDRISNNNDDRQKTEKEIEKIGGKWLVKVGKIIGVTQSIEPQQYMPSKRPRRGDQNPMDGGLDSARIQSPQRLQVEEVILSADGDYGAREGGAQQIKMVSQDKPRGGKGKDYQKKLIAIVNELISNDRQVNSRVSDLENLNRQRRDFKDQFKQLKMQHPENNYIDKAIEGVKDDIQKDGRIHDTRKKQINDINRLFFDRFSGNQDDWKEDHSFIFKYTETLVKEGETDTSAEELASTMHVLQEVKPSTGIKEQSQLSESYLDDASQDKNDGKDGEEGKQRRNKVHADKLIEQVKSIPDCLQAPWLVSWCMKDGQIDNEQNDIPEEEEKEKVGGWDQAAAQILSANGELPMIDAAKKQITSQQQRRPDSDKEGIRHFTFQFINTEKIGPHRDCQHSKHEPSTVELLLGNKLKTILVQKVGKDGIQTVLIMDQVGHMTALNVPNTETMFDRTQWRVFNIDPSEILIDMCHTDSFSQIEFVVCKQPKLKTGRNN